MKVSPGSMALAIRPGIAAGSILISESESGVRLLPSLGGGLRLDITQVSSICWDTKKLPGFLFIFKWRSSINNQPLFVLSLSLLYLVLLFCGLLWYWQHCMLVVTVCLQGSIKTKWVCTNEVPALAALTSPNGRNQSQKNHFFSSAPPRPGSRYRNIRIDASLYHASRPRISCITQNTSNSWLSQYLHSTILMIAIH